jgi:hypothetical protein
MAMMTTMRKPATRRTSERRAVRFAATPLAIVPASPAAPIAHPFSHSEGRARCPACELREYLDG